MNAVRAPRHAIATVSLSGTLREKLDAIAAAGFDGVEIFENDLLACEEDAGAVRRMVADLGLEIVAFQPFRDFEGMPDAQRHRAFERAERKFDLMQELGAELLLVCSNVSPAALGGSERAAADLHELAERAARRGLRIGFEALAWGRHINDYRDAWEVVRRADHPALGTILDSFHILSQGLALEAIATLPPERIFLVQIADAPLLNMDILQWSRHFRCFPGQGRLPLTDFIRALDGAGYEGVLSLEIFNDRFRAAPPRQIAVDGRRSLLRLAEQAGEAHNDGVTAAWPPQVAYQGLEFLEFAVDEVTAGELEQVFRQLGFRRRGRHRSKAVELWRQGDINLVINCDKEGFGHYYNIVHGPSVCAVGVRVDDAGKALARAQGYLCQPFAQAVGPGELEIPAIYGLENSLVYLVERHGDRGSIWEVDFELDAGASSDGEPGGLQCVDHIGQVLPHYQLTSWQLFYCSVFGFDAAEQYDLADPSGLIQSQVVESRDRRIRIALNASQSHTTMAHRFVARYYGGGVQQIAFACDNIFATLHGLQARGVPLLPIPENYYDDLEARFGLDGALLDKLKRYHILYDQDQQGGEFFHAYTQTFAERFYFEIVERRGYSDFGAVNAPIRLAAQSRMAQHGSPSAERRR